MRTGIIVFFLCMLALGPAFAQTPERAPGVADEQVAREVGRALRCVVCQNQSIEDSDAPLAADMRALVRRRLAAGDSPDAVVAFMQDRYGDYVLLKPPVQTNTYVLWFSPFILLIAVLVYVARRTRRAAQSVTAPLSEDEVQAFESLKQQARDEASS